MTHRYVRYLLLGLRLLFPTPEQARYVRLIRDSGAFDRAWYLACNPRLPRLCRMLPERHYVLVGESVGLCPWPGFSPRAYAYLNPDQPMSGMPPLAHYLAVGRAAGRQAIDQPAGADAPVLPVLTPQERPLSPARVAVVLHLHYRDMWPDFAARLGRQEFDFDLFVTLTKHPDHSDLPIRAQIAAQFPKARIWTFPNHGRDILPFLHLAQSGLLDPYAAICKLHSKRSPHRVDGLDWRDLLLDGVLGDALRIAARLDRFLDHPQAGLWVADGQRLSGAAWWGPNWPRYRDLMAQAGLAAGTLDALVFAAGSIYWMKPEVLARLAVLPLRAGDFELEMGQVDGTTAHALERSIGAFVQAAGLEIVQASELDAQGRE
jgi:lipopolysaccharide biosynthesis protein